MISHPETSQHSVLHHRDELFMAETIVSVEVEDLEDCVQNVLRELVSCGNLHSSFKLSYSGVKAGESKACWVLQLHNRRAGQYDNDPAIYFNHYQYQSFYNT